MIKRGLAASFTFVRRLVRSPYWRTNAPLVVLQMGLVGIAGLCQVWALATYLPRQEVGHWGHAAAIVAIASIFALPGSAQPLAYAAAHRMDGALMQTFRLRLRWGILCGASLLVAAVVHHLLDQTNVAAMLAIAAVLAPVQLAADSADAYLSGRGEFRLAFVRKLIAYPMIAVTTIAVAAIFRDVVLCTLAAYFSGTVLNLLFLHLTLRILRNEQQYEGLNQMNVRFGGLSVLSLVSNNLERPLLGAFAGFHQLGAYQVAKSFALPVSFGRVVEKLLLSQLARRDQHMQLVKDLAIGTALLFAAGWAAYLVCDVVFSWVFARLLPHYGDSLSLLYVLLLQMPFNWAAKPVQSWLYAHPQHHRLYWLLSWSSPVSRLVLLAAGALAGGIAGAAWGWVASEVFFFLMAISMLIARGFRGGNAGART